MIYLITIIQKKKKIIARMHPGYFVDKKYSLEKFELQKILKQIWK